MINETMDVETVLATRNSEMLCSDLLEVMHNIAQPLTILQVRLDKSLADQLNATELRRLVDDSAKEVERLCNMFGYLQGFITAEYVEPELTSEKLASLLGHLAEGLSLFFKDAGMQLHIALPDSGYKVLVDQNRMYQALSRVLLVTYSLSMANDTIELIGSTSSKGMQVVIRNRTAHALLDKEARCKLALAAANIRRQHGNLTWTTDPFTVHIELPCAPSFA